MEVNFLKNFEALKNFFFKGQPYEGCTDEQVMQFVQEGSYLAIPEFCPPAVYAQMVECFNENASRRPTFAELNSKFQVFFLSFLFRKN